MFIHFFHEASTRHLEAFRSEMMMRALIDRMCLDTCLDYPDSRLMCTLDFSPPKKEQ